MKNSLKICEIEENLYRTCQKPPMIMKIPWKIWIFASDVIQTSVHSDGHTKILHYSRLKKEITIEPGWEFRERANLTIFVRETQKHWNLQWICHENCLKIYEIQENWYRTSQKPPMIMKMPWKIWIFASDVIQTSVHSDGRTKILHYSRLKK